MRPAGPRGQNPVKSLMYLKYATHYAFHLDTDPRKSSIITRRPPAPAAMHSINRQPCLKDIYILPADGYGQVHLGSGGHRNCGFHRPHPQHSPRAAGQSFGEVAGISFKGHCKVDSLREIAETELAT